MSQFVGDSLASVTTIASSMDRSDSDADSVVVDVERTAEAEASVERSASRQLEESETNRATISRTPLAPRGSTRKSFATGCLTEERLADLARHNPDLKSKVAETQTKLNDFIDPNVISNIAYASYSQFPSSTDPRLKQLLPPLSGDCCQTFSTLMCAVCSSMATVGAAEKVLRVSPFNSMVYTAAWMHQLTQPKWGANGQKRPPVRDVIQVLNLKNTFGIVADVFEPVMYSNPARGEALIRKLIEPQVEGPRTCGYVVVSGEYAFSVFAVPQSDDVWALFLADSHGHLPWAPERAAAVMVGPIVHGMVDSGEHKPMLSADEGVRQFCRILFATLEECRRRRAVSSLPGVQTRSMIKAEEQRKAAEERRKTEARKAATIHNVDDDVVEDESSCFIVGTKEGGRPSQRGNSDDSTETIPYTTWTPIVRESPGTMDFDSMRPVVEKWQKEMLSDGVVAVQRKRFPNFGERPAFWLPSKEETTPAKPVANLVANPVAKPVAPTTATLTLARPQPKPAPKAAPKKAAPKAVPVKKTPGRKPAAASKQPPASPAPAASPTPAKRISAQSAPLQPALAQPAPALISQPSQSPARPRFSIPSSQSPVVAGSPHRLPLVEPRVLDVEDEPPRLMPRRSK